MQPAVSNQSFVDAAFLDRKPVMFGLFRLHAWSSDPTDFARSMISIIG